MFAIGAINVSSPEWGLLYRCLRTRGMTDILSLDPHNILHPLDLDTRRRSQELCCRWDSLCQGPQGCFPPRLQQPGNMIRRNLSGESVKLKRICRIKFLSEYSNSISLNPTWHGPVHLEHHPKWMIKTRDSFGICSSWAFQNCPWKLNLTKIWL